MSVEPRSRQLAGPLPRPWHRPCRVDWQEGARHHGYTGAGGYHPLLAKVLMSAVAPPTSCQAGPGDNSRLLLRPHCRCRLPGRCPLPARQPARRYQRSGLPMDGRRRRCRRDDHPVPDQAGPAPVRLIVRADARFPGPLRQIQISLHHRPRGETGTGGRSSPAEVGAVFDRTASG